MAIQANGRAKTKNWNYNDPDEPYFEDDEEEEGSDHSSILTDEQDRVVLDVNATSAAGKKMQQNSSSQNTAKRSSLTKLSSSKKRQLADDAEYMTPTIARNNKLVMLSQTSSGGGKSTPKTPRTSQVAAEDEAAAQITQSPSSVHAEAIVSEADAKRRRIRKLEEYLKTLEDKQEALDYTRAKLEKGLELCRSELLSFVQEEAKLLEEMPTRIKQARLSARFDLDQPGSASKKQKTN